MEIWPVWYLRSPKGFIIIDSSKNMFFAITPREMLNDKSIKSFAIFSAHSSFTLPTSKLFMLIKDAP